MRLGIRLGTDGHVDIGEITAVENQEPPKLWDLTAISRSTYLSDDWAHGSERENIEEMSKVNWKTIMVSAAHLVVLIHHSYHFCTESQSH